MRKVLITDDAAFMRTMLGDICKQAGYIVFEAKDGKDLLKRYVEVKPDIVTLDITMPNMDGIEALKELKKIDSNAKVIMCSAMGQQSLVLEAIKSGAMDFIVKPFVPERVTCALNKVIS